MVSLGVALRQPDLRAAMNVYWEKIALPLINKRKRLHLTLTDVAWQIDDWEWTWDKEHACHCRSRGGSKTFDYVNYVIFRAIRTNEQWMWITPKGGQRIQSSKYFRENPLIKGQASINIGNTHIPCMELVTGDLIIFGAVSTNYLGLRVDGIVNDEEESMENKQTEEVYPQMEGCMTDSQTGQFIHLGTLWIGSLFNEHVEEYPSTIIPWDRIPHLTTSPKMQRIMANSRIPEWQKDLLYRCIPTSPNGVLLPNIHRISFQDPEHIPWRHPENYGMDFGAIDCCAGITWKSPFECYVCSEQEFDIERYPDAIMTLCGRPIEGEAGGYNDSDRYGEKATKLAQYASGTSVPCTNAWKAQRQDKARQIEIYIDPEVTPQIYKDLKRAVFGPDGLYKKVHGDPLWGMHWLDAFLHAIGASPYRYYDDTSDILVAENRREREYQRSLHH